MPLNPSTGSTDRSEYGRHLSEMAAYIHSLPPREQSAISNREPVPQPPVQGSEGSAKA